MCGCTDKKKQQHGPLQLDYNYKKTEENVRKCSQNRQMICSYTEYLKTVIFTCQVIKNDKQCRLNQKGQIKKVFIQKSTLLQFTGTFRGVLVSTRTV